jgi:lysophospholipase L1-like esterase
MAGLLAMTVALGAGQSAAQAAPSPHANPIPPSAAAEVGLHVVGLGDSVLTALDRCHCPGLLVDYAGLVADRLQERIRVENQARGAATSNDVLDALKSDRVQGSVRSADLVVLFVGANDFSDAFRKVAHGSPAQYRYAPVAEQLEHNVGESIEQIRQLNGQAHIVVCGYWNDFKDGAVARREYSSAQQRAAAQATSYTNDALTRAAQNAHVDYLSTLQLFQSKGDMTPLLAADGDHLSAAGHTLIAQALADLLHPDAGNSAESPIDPGLNRTR